MLNTNVQAHEKAGKAVAHSSSSIALITDNGKGLGPVQQNLVNPARSGRKQR